MKARGFSLVELLIVIAIVAVLSGIILAVVVNSKKSAYSASCLSNMRQIGAAAQLYASDNDEMYGFNILGSNIWLQRLGLTTEVKRQNMPTLSCPTFQNLPEKGNDTYSGYSYNVCSPEKAPPEPSRTVMIGEHAVYYPVSDPTMVMSADFLYMPDSYWVDGRKWIVDQFNSQYKPIGEWGAVRHQGRGNYVFFDGGAKSYPPQAFRIPESGHPCSRPTTGWIGPANGPTFNPHA